MMAELTISLSDCPIWVYIVHFLDSFLAKRCSTAVNEPNATKVILCTDLFGPEDLDNYRWHLEMDL
jgi:hypothetical protein